MHRLGLKYIAAAALACFAATAAADDELVIYAFDDGLPATGAIVVLDGDKRQPVDESGEVVFDLSAGQHSVAVTKGGTTLHSFNFSSAQGQLVDINVALRDDADPQVSVERYFETETARDRAQAPKGSVIGTLRLGGSVLPRAELRINERDTTVEADGNGRFRVELPRGIYELEITHPSLESPATESLRVVSDMEITQNIRLGSPQQRGPAATGAIEEVVAVAKFRPSAFAESEQFSSNVLETIGLEQLSRFGDSDVAASVVRVPSVTVQDSRFVFIRGLGGRYVTTTLNGATLPSTDPTKREVPLDLFPSNIVKQLDVKKTFLAGMPGESTGGNLVINTRTFPDESSGKLSVSLGYTSGLTGQRVDADPFRSSTDYFGFDRAERDEPGGAEAIAALFDCCSDQLSAGEQQQLGRIAGELIKDGFDLDTATAGPEISIGGNFGDVYDLQGMELGFFVAGNYKNGWTQKDKGVRRTYSAAGDVLDDFEFRESNFNVEASGLAALGLNVGDSSYQANTLVSRSTDNRVRVSEGIDGDEFQPAYSYSIDYAERQFLSQQFAGEHLIGPAGDLVANWQVTGSQATRYAPDRREVRFSRVGDEENFRLEVPELVRRYDDLVDNNVDASADLEYIFDSALGESTLQGGFQVISRERDSESSSYGFQGGQNVDDLNVAPNRRVDDVINSDNITGDTGTGYTFQDKTLESDSYEAELELNSLFLSYGLRFLNDFQVIAGARYEAYEQTTDTNEVLSGDPLTSRIDDDVLLPSLSFNWDITQDQKLRLAATKTVSRPDFKETSNATFYDPQFDFRVRGNPLLEVSEVINLDGRWELYWSEQESVSVALFYKDIDSPIERVLQRASGTAGNSRTFRNGESAEIYGVEVDGRRDFALGESAARNIFVALNASLIESEIQLQSGESRKLQGQPDYTFNFVLGYDDFASKYRQEITALLNQSGETIVDVGLTDALDDIVEEPRLSLDLNYKIFLSENLAIKAKARNLLNAEVEFTQGGKVFQKYEEGVELEAGIDWSF
ncbi:TonB-dependent receptor [Algiphilus aromaticivorans]|uniref:TonB-dependent receptor n=1 Tax=Algiphilus aromaticivorans TaxID=382454 RepID=UPI0005C22E55|nr:TonB-dependent receptor [Algiphilus aromaticivorans]